MNLIFQVLYDTHRLLPIFYLLLLAIGLIGPAIYCAIKNIPHSIGKIFHESKKGDAWALFIIINYIALVLTTIGILIFKSLGD